MDCNNDMPNKSYFVKQLLIQRLHEKGLSVEDISREAGVSRSHIIREFKKTFNITPLRFLSECRIEKAKKIIENNINISLKEFADQCGYSSIFYFSKRFKQIAGYNPSEHSFKSSVYKGNVEAKKQVAEFKCKQLYNDAINLENRRVKFDINQVNDALKMVLRYDGDNTQKMRAKISRIQKYVEKGVRDEKNRLHNK